MSLTGASNSMAASLAGGQASEPATGMEKVRQDVLAKKTLDIVEPDQLQDFYDYLVQYKEKCLQNEQYLDARDANNLMNAVKSEINKNNPPKTDEQQVKSQGSTIVGDKIAKITKDLNNFDKETSLKMNELHKKHSEQLEKFETDWREVMPEKYRKPSQKYVELKQSALDLAYAGQYEEAETRKQECEALKVKEYQEAKWRMDREYRQARNKLMKQFKYETEHLNDQRKLQKDLLISQKNQLESAVQKRDIVLRTKPSAPMRKSQNAAHDGVSSTIRKAKERKSFTSSDVKLPPLTPPNAEKRNNYPSKAQTQASTNRSTSRSNQPAAGNHPQ